MEIKYKDFEIRQSKSIDGDLIADRYEVVKWYGHDPIECYNREGKKIVSIRSCFVIAWLTWKNDEFKFESCGPRYLEYSDESLNDFILAWMSLETFIRRNS